MFKYLNWNTDAVLGLKVCLDKLTFSIHFYSSPGVISYPIKIQSRCFINGQTDFWVL